MRSLIFKKWLSLILSMSLCLSLSSCGDKKAGAIAGALVCSLLAASVDQKALTVGFAADFLSAIKSKLGLFALDDDAVNSSIQTTINSALDAASIGSSIKVSSVQSIAKSSDGSDDGVRFLNFEGDLAVGVSFVSNLLENTAVQSAISGNLGLTNSNPFSFIEDSYRVYLTGKLSSLGMTKNTSKQWAYSQTNLTNAQSIAAGLTNAKNEVVVAVIDTGVDIDHPALADNLYKKNGQVVGYDFANNDDNADDDQGHGTHCAGIIAAKNEGTDGMVGVSETLAAGKIKIMPIKVLAANGSGSTANINKGVRWAMANGADVISMSLGGGMDFKDLTSANGTESSVIRDAINAGIIVVVAAGNENCPLGGVCEQSSLFVLSKTIDEYTVLPCSYNGTICVGASDPDVTVASYSNYPSAKSKGVDPVTTSNSNKRTSPDIIAPGSQIYSTYNDGAYRFLDGTSMATPLVAGLAGIYKLKVSSALEGQKGSNSQVLFRDLLQKSEIALKLESSDTRSYVGQVDVNYFMSQLQSFINGSDAGSAPDLNEVTSPKPDTGGSGGDEVPNLLSSLCSG